MSKITKFGCELLQNEEKGSPVKFANFVYICITRGLLSRKWLFSPRIIQNIQNLRTFTTFSNLCSFTHSKTLFLAVLLDFVLLALIKI
jgi:hypothetical protein